MRLRYILSILFLALIGFSCSKRLYISQSAALDLVALDLEVLPDFNKDDFLQYLDTTAIDDWEGIWVFMTPKYHNCVAIERINDNHYNPLYTHRIIQVFSDIQLSKIYPCKEGSVIGYLGQELYDNTCTIFLYEFEPFNVRTIETSIMMDKTHSLITFADTKRYWNVSSTRVGMRRLFPIRSIEEGKYRVRYL